MKTRSKRGTSPVDTVIGQNLKNIRTQRGLSQSALGEQLQLTFQQIQKYEKGTNRIAASTLLAMTQVLGVSIDSFFRGTDDLPTDELPSIPALSSQAYRLAVLYDTNKNPAFKKAVAGLFASAVGNNVEQEDEETTEH